MSTKETAYKLIDSLNERQLKVIISIMNEFAFPNLSDFPEAEPDEWDIEMIKRAETENNGETVSLEEFADRWGLILNAV